MRRMHPMATPRRRYIAVPWEFPVLICLGLVFIGGVVVGHITFPMISQAELDRMVGVIPTQTTVSAPLATTGEAQAEPFEPFDPIGPIPKDLLNSAPDSNESSKTATTTEVVDPDPGELPDLPDDEYLCDSVEIVILPVGGNVWRIAKTLDKDEDTRVDWADLLRIYPDTLAKTLQPGAVIVIPIKGKLGPLATKIAYGD